MPQSRTLIIRSLIVRPNVRCAPRLFRRPAAGMTAAIMACLAIASFAPAAHAGATLLSRHSVIHASGAAGMDQQQTSDGFSTFANQVGTGDGSVNGVMSMAHQFSTPGVSMPSGAGLQGAFGEGQVRSKTTSSAGPAMAESGFDMTFSVDGGPAVYTIGAAMGSAGNGAVMLQLLPLTGNTRSAVPLFVSNTTPGEGGAEGTSREVETSGFLAPGRYMLSVHADSQDTTARAEESNAYYTFSFSLSDANVGGPAVAVPLPAAVWAAGSLLGLIAGGQVLQRRRRSA